MKNKLKSKNLKPATVDWKVMLKRISNISSVLGCLKIRKDYGEFLVKWKSFRIKGMEWNLSFERQTFSLKEESVTKVLWSVMFCLDINIQSK